LVATALQSGIAGKVTQSNSRGDIEIGGWG